MKRIILLVLAMVAITTLSKADGFINTQDNMFYGKTYTIQYTDEVPTESLQYYFAYSLDNGMNWTRFSDTLVWTCPDTANAPLTIMRTGLAKVGIFTNPNGEWMTVPYTFDATFMYSNAFEFITQPDTIFNTGSYDFNIRTNPTEVPPEMMLQYSTNSGGIWLNWSAITFNDGQATKNISISNGPITTETIWRLLYTNPNYVVCTSTPIPYKERSTFFNFKTKGGQKEISDKATLLWESSYNFKKIEITTYFDNEVLDVTEYETDGIEVNFAKNGEYTIIGVAKDANFIITKSLSFTVGDPCSFVKAQAVILRDSIEVLNATYDDTKAKYDSLNALYTEAMLKIDTLKFDNANLLGYIDTLRNYIIMLQRDSLKIQLVYNEGCLVDVKDEAFVSQLETVHATLSGQNHILITVPEALQNKALTWWCYDMLGNFIQAETTLDLPYIVEIKQGMAHGAYIWYTLYEGVYKAYKFIL